MPDRQRSSQASSRSPFYDHNTNYKKKLKADADVSEEGEILDSDDKAEEEEDTAHVDNMNRNKDMRDISDVSLSSLSSNGEIKQKQKWKRKKKKKKDKKHKQKKVRKSSSEVVAHVSGDCRNRESVEKHFTRKKERQLVGDEESETSDRQLVEDEESELSDSQLVEDEEGELYGRQLVEDKEKELSDRQLVEDEEGELSDRQLVEDMEVELSDRQLVEEEEKEMSERQLVEDEESEMSDKQLVEDEESEMSDRQFVEDEERGRCVRHLVEEEANSSDADAVKVKQEPFSSEEEVDEVVSEEELEEEEEEEETASRHGGTTFRRENYKRRQHWEDHRSSSQKYHRSHRQQHRKSRRERDGSRIRSGHSENHHNREEHKSRKEELRERRRRYERRKHMREKRKEFSHKRGSNKNWMSRADRGRNQNQEHRNGIDNGVREKRGNGRLRRHECGHSDAVSVSAPRDNRASWKPSSSRWDEEMDAVVNDPVKEEVLSDCEDELEHQQRREGGRQNNLRSGGAVELNFGEPGAGSKAATAETQSTAAPDFELSGKLTEDTNTYNGVVVKYSEPPEARKPRVRWRLYVFKGEEELPILYIHRQSAYLLGRDRKVADIPIDHPSCSKQHAVFQFRLVTYSREDGRKGRRVRPYIIDLDSANGTYVNNQRIESKRYVELREKDMLKFGYSSREYVLLHEHSTDDADIYEAE